MKRAILQKVVTSFDRKEFAHFFRAANDRFIQQMAPLRGYETERFDDFLVLGEMPLEGPRRLLVLAVRVRGNLSEHSSRKAQFDIARRILNDRYPGHWGTICVFHDEHGAFRFSLIHRQYDERRVTFNPFRRFTYFIHPEEPNRTFLERIGDADFSTSAHIREAFSVEKVTNEFFEDYLDIFNELQTHLFQFSKDKVWSHDYALQVLNRLMFLYFIQKKRWLGDDPHFMRHYWETYKKSSREKDSFFEDWLSVLFFEAFNGKFKAGRADRQYLPEEMRRILAMTPYLNGGLFTRNDLDDKYSIPLPDQFFEQLFEHYKGSIPGFLERYNFTITEATPFDIDVAVDPEMIGKVYEKLVNITFEGISERDQRGDSGIYYTERTEIDLMCRLSLVDCLANYLGEEHKPLLYDTVFAHDPEEKEKADRALATYDLWSSLEKVLKEITVCDPACGSGSFLIGMLLVLDDLQSRANAQLGIEETTYRRRRRIIGNQLYGVDVMDWAVHVAELRLWLQLAIETDLKPEELTLQPLLPNLSFNVRCGNSLLQEIGGIDLGLRRTSFDIPSDIRGRITALQGRKRRFYQGASEIKRRDLEREERTIFLDLLKSRRYAIKNEIKILESRKEKGEGQTGLVGFGDTQEKSHKEVLKTKEEIRRKEEELAEVERAIETLSKVEVLPFVWDIAFVEIFKGEKKGFDIVMGNPPYVRQEKIAWPGDDPNQYGGENSERWKERKKEYKEKLQRSIALAWPRFFNYHKVKGTFEKTDAKSDLYIYFYFHGLSLLNPKGSFCFITSNSWLDVGYGADLQEFLLKHSHVKFILDNERKRSFAQADVNTIIALLAPPDDRREEGLNKTARFVMFTVPFEEVLDAETFKTLETATERQSTDRWRISVRPQCDLLEEGLVTDEEDQPTAKLKTVHIKTARYEANKWGGKYLRAPEIFFTILEKGKGKLVRLGDIAEVNEGRPTGANEFFYVPKPTAKEFGIEPQFLFEGLMKTRGFNRFVITAASIDRYFLSVDLPRSDLKGTNVLGYIEHGERIGLHKRNTFSSKQDWYRFKVRRPAELLAPCGLGSTFFCALNKAKAISSNSYTEFRLSRAADALPLWVVLNSAVFWLELELVGRSSLGGGLLKVDPIEYRQIFVPKTDLLVHRLAEFNDYVGRLRQRYVDPIESELRQPDRRALDDVVFDVLGLTAGEREAVYEAVVALVRARLEKAKSV